MSKALQYSRMLIMAKFQGAAWPLKDGEAFEASLHASNPFDDAGTLLAKSEVDYHGYRRVTIPRDAAHWKIISDLGGFYAVNLRDIAFPPVVREKAGNKKYECRHLLLRGAESGLAVRVGSSFDKPLEIDADHPFLIAKDQYRVSQEGRIQSIMWNRRILECEFLNHPFPLQQGEDFEMMLYKDDPQGKDGVIVGKEVDYPGYHRIVVKRTVDEWKRHDNEVSNIRKLAFPGPHEEQAKGKKWTIRWYAIVGKESGFPAVVSRLDDTVVIKAGVRFAVPAGTGVFSER